MKLKDVEIIKDSWRVPSKSHYGTYYTIELWSDNKLYCNCLAGKMMRNCHHKGIIRDYLKANDKETYEKLKCLKKKRKNQKK